MSNVDGTTVLSIKGLDKDPQNGHKALRYEIVFVQEYEIILHAVHNVRTCGIIFLVAATRYTFELYKSLYCSCAVIICDNGMGDSTLTTQLESLRYSILPLEPYFLVSFDISGNPMREWHYYTW